MSHTVSGLLRKPPFIKDNCGQDGQSKMYAIELSEMTKDYQTQEKTYTNYKALFFAKTDAARSYYDKAFADGSFVVVTCEKLKVEQREHNGTNYISLQMENARLEAAKFDDLQSSQGQQSAQQRPAQKPAPAYQAPQQGYSPAPQQQGYGQQQQQQRPAQNQSPARRPPVQQHGNAAYQAPQQGYAQAPQQQGMQMPADDGWDDGSDIPF